MGPTATTDPSFRDLRTPEEIEALGNEWDALLSSGGRPSPFQLSSWVAAWIREFGDTFEPCVTVAQRGSRVVGIAPFVVRRAGRVRVAHFVGGHESSLADLLLAEDEPLSTAERLLESLPRAGADALNAYGVPGDSVLARAAGKRLRLIPRVGAPVLEMPQGWEAAYQRRVSGSSRNKNRAKERKLAGQGSLEVVLAHDRESVAAALDEAFEVHRTRWQGRPDGSTFGQPERNEFMRSAIATLADEGHYGICLLRLDGRAISFASWFEVGATFYGHRTAFDPAFARYGIGVIAQRHGIAAASGRGARRVEFMGDAEESKLSIADRLDPMHQAVGLARGLEGRVYIARVIAAVEARKRLKKVERLHRAYRSGSLRASGERAA